MYMPGRSRTGSSPSRTVMSLAVYVASLIEKALETGRFRALRILPEHTVGICLCEAQSGCFCDDFAKVLVLDLGGQILGLETVFVGGLDGGSDPPSRRLEPRVPGAGRRGTRARGWPPGPSPSRRVVRALGDDPGRARTERRRGGGAADDRGGLRSAPPRRGEGRAR